MVLCAVLALCQCVVSDRQPFILKWLTSLRSILSIKGEIEVRNGCGGIVLLCMIDR